MNIRLASIDDAEGIARVNVAGWKTTYRGIISDSFLDQLSIEGRRASLVERFHDSKTDLTTFVLEDQHGQIVGFAAGGVSREAELEFDSELYAIYLRCKEGDMADCFSMLLKMN